MNALLFIFALLLGGAVGGAVGFLVRQRRDEAVMAKAQEDAAELRRSAQEEAERIVAGAQSERRDLIGTERERLEAEADRARSVLESDLERLRQVAQDDLARGRTALEEERASVRELRDEVKRDRERVDASEERLNRRGEQQDSRALRLDDQEERLDEREAELKARADDLDSQRAEVERQLFDVAQLSREGASEIILNRLDGELEREKAVRIRAELDKADAEAKRKSTNIIAQAIQRSASEVSAAISVSVVPIPSDNMKGRIIGREGRNIRAFEALTGVDLIIDDTPEAVLLSSFNPIRREVAKLALSELVADGRIHPARIEEMVQKGADRDAGVTSASAATRPR